MKQLNFNPLDPNRDFEQRKSQLIDTYSKDPTVLAWLVSVSSNSDKQSEILRKNIFKIDQWMQNESKCFHCNGLDQCPYAIKGRKPSLAYNGAFVENCFVQCHYYKQDKIKYAFLDNFIRNDYPFLKDYKMQDLLKLDESGAAGHAVLAKLNPFLTEFPLDKGGYLYGALGTGKTVSAAIVANEYAKKGYTVSFVNIISFIESCKKCFDTKDNQAISNKLYDLKKADILIIDDIGCESNSAWSRDEILFNVLNYRMEHHKATWFTSNLSMEDLKIHFAHNSNASEEGVKAARLMERIMTLATPILYQGFNFRRA